MHAARPLLLALLVPVLAVAGCTSSEKSSTGDFQGEQRNVAQAVEDLQSAGQDGDGTKICEQLLAADLVRTIETASKRRCPEVLDDALDDVDVFDLDVKKVAVSGGRATATVESENGDKDRMDTLTLTRDGRNWKIAALGGIAAG